MTFSDVERHFRDVISQICSEYGTEIKHILATVHSNQYEMIHSLTL